MADGNPNRSLTDMRYNLTRTLVIGVAGLALVACEKKTTDAQADAVRDTSQAAASSMESSADAIEDRGEVMGDAATNNAEATADGIRDRADAVKERGEKQADAIEAGTIGATTKTDTLTTTTVPATK
jgi:hypothetical protein